jgi:hypothetical protein|tara:strand:- start:832 stop:1071 length:240 start_codon:yes stop_codon:yes gene_type:complete
MKRSINIISTWIGMLIALVLMAAILTIPTQYLWNTCLVPAIDGINTIGFWQALGINILSSILFKGSRTTKENSNIDLKK